MVTRSRIAVDTFVNILCEYKEDRVFNPWTMNCEYVDVDNSFGIRRENLRAVLYACVDADEVDVWIARDLGWRGGRRTGVALVDEYSLGDYALSLNVASLTKATVGPSMRERTATEVHLARVRVARKVFFWNVFPFHPHEIDKPQSNRMHTRREHDVGMAFLKNILMILPLGRILAVGNDAAKALQALGIEYFSVRHPSYGGQKYFHQQIDTHYDVPKRDNDQEYLFI